MPGIAQTIVAETRQLIDYDTIRVYHVDPDTGWCEPIAYQGSFADGVELRRRSPARPDRRRTDRVGRRARPDDPPRGRHRRPPGITLESSGEPASALLVPMIYEGTVHGVLVVSKDGLDQFTADDETTLTIFAGYAAHAIVNATTCSGSAGSSSSSSTSSKASAGSSRSTNGCCRCSSRPASST